MEVRGPNLIICYLYLTTGTESLLPGEDHYFCPQALNLTLKTFLSLPRLLLIFLSRRTPFPFQTSLPHPFSWSLSPGTLCPMECRKCESHESLSQTQDTYWLLSSDLCHPGNQMGQPATRLWPHGEEPFTIPKARQDQTAVSQAQPHRPVVPQRK